MRKVKIENNALVNAETNGGIVCPMQSRRDADVLCSPDCAWFSQTAALHPYKAMAYCGAHGQITIGEIVQ